ncbi:hypothetical protein Micbo1qcDRAFT_50238 [Microdochium bolleyi]|uniref:Uncharacterized protein n=1 Tax=Microdochium bolleyi TaxID=196109 RepID=A0A136J6B9_9PEZI|nr:hypothetical protein Micbo1qcDRAFT_50238 [Microdochium bolleyi]
MTQASSVVLGQYGVPAPVPRPSWAAEAASLPVRCKHEGNICDREEQLNNKRGTSATSMDQPGRGRCGDAHNSHSRAQSAAPPPARRRPDRAPSCALPAVCCQHPRIIVPNCTLSVLRSEDDCACDCCVMPPWCGTTKPLPTARPSSGITDASAWPAPSSTTVQVRPSASTRCTCARAGGGNTP